MKFKELNEAVRVKEERKIFWSDLQKACIENKLFTVGDNEQFKDLYKLCDKYPTDDIIYEISKMIYDCSVDQTIENIMFIIGNSVVKRFYTVR